MKSKNLIIILLSLLLVTGIYFIFFNEEHEHGDEHMEHGKEITEVDKTKITDSAAKKMGIVIDKVQNATISQTLQLTGRITLNQNKKAKVLARFPGVVKEVKVNLGEQVKKDQVLAIVESNQSLRTYDIKAPINGAVLERNTNIGDVASSEPIFVIADLSTVWAKFHVFSEDTEKVKADQAVQIHTIDDDVNAKGKIDMVFPTADELSQTHIVIVELSNDEGKWRPGMTVEGDVSIYEKDVRLAVKESALQKLDSDEYVIFVKKNDEYIAKQVITGIRGGGYVEIKNGLEEGELYVAEGSFIIKSDILKSTAEHEH